MAATQLRRYEIVPGQLDDFLAWFPRIVAVREQFGFTVDGAWVDRERNEFVWLVSHPGDFDAVFAVYNESPERAAVFEGQPQRVAQMYLSMVEPLPLRSN